MRFALLLRSMGYQTAASITSLAAVFFVSAALSALTPRVVLAQSYSPRTQRPGQTLRWVTVEGQTGRGKLLEPLDPVSRRLILRTGHRMCTNFDPCVPEMLELDAIRQLEVRVAIGTRRGAAIGGGSGLLFGAGDGCLF